MSSDGPPKRLDSSLELTAVRPRPPLQDAEDIMLTDMLADAERARRDLEDTIETLVACPGPCTACPCCKGAFMVTHERRQQWRDEHEPPPSRPEAA